MKPEKNFEGSILTEIDAKIALLETAYAITKAKSWEWNCATKTIVWIDESLNLNSVSVCKSDIQDCEALLGMVVSEDRQLIKDHLTGSHLRLQNNIEYRVTEGGRLKYKKLTIQQVNVGEAYNLRGIIWDISQQKDNENELQKLNEAFEQSEQLANVGNWQMNADSSTIFSGNLYKIFGVEPESFAPGPETFAPFVHPDDRNKIVTQKNLDLHPEQAMKTELRIVQPNGDIKHVKSISKKTTNNIGEKVILGTVQDITGEVMLRRNLQENASFNQMMVDNNLDAVSAYDRELKLTAWNKICEEKSGLAKIDVIGKHVSDIIINEEADEFINDLKSALKGNIIHRQKRNAGSEFFDLFISPLNNNGEIFGVLCIAHDLTEIKNVTDKLVELNHSLKQKNEELERSNNELASFSYVASHDLQEPLRKIQTFSNRIMEREYEHLSEQGLEYFKRMESAAKRMQILIDDLLTFSRTSTQQKEFTEMDLNEMLLDVKEEIKERIDEKNAVIENDPMPVTSVIRFQFKQLLANILLNALKYNKPGVSPHIQIKCSQVDVAHEPLDNGTLKGIFYKLDFIDNGIGFDQQYNQKIFELFQRLHGKSEYPGTGLGLAICRRIMKNHEGLIVAHGQLGVGSRFTVYLPVS